MLPVQSTRPPRRMSNISNPRGPHPLIREVSSASTATDASSDDSADDQEPPTFTDNAPFAPISFISPFASAAATKPIPLPTIQVRRPTQDGFPFPVKPKRRPTFERRSSLAPLKDGRRGSALPPRCRAEVEAEATAAKQPSFRRASVDVGTLSAQNPLTIRRGSKRLKASPEHRRDAEETDNEASENNLRQLRASMFAEHLTALLNHSISLASGRGETSLDLFVRGKELSPIHINNSPSAAAKLQAISMPNSASLTSDHGLFNSSNYSAALASSPTAQNNFQHFRLKKRASQPDLDNARRARLVNNLSQWSFNALVLQPEELYECAVLMFEAFLYLKGVAIGVPLANIKSLLLAIQSAYHARNGYHNFTHATDILQATYSFLSALQLVPPITILTDPNAPAVWTRPAHLEQSGGLGRSLRPMDLFSLMIAAIGHDVGHPGLSNAYMVNAKTPVAQVYGDKSVLENFHTVTLIQMLKNHGLGHLFGTADREPIESDEDCRKVLFASVLATDMSQHFTFVARLQNMAARLKDHPRTPEEAEEDRLLLCCGLMKCADISNPSRPHQVAKAWSTALLQEWSVQAKIETEFKLPVSVITLNPAEAKAQAKSQVGFINLFTQPLFDAMAGTVQGFDGFAQNCREGRRVWEQFLLEAGDQMAVPTPAIKPTAASPSSSLAAKSKSSKSRRQPPPHPLNFNFRSRDSHDSAMSSGLISASTPLSPTSQSSMSWASTSATSITSTGKETPAQCTGQCGLVTARCPTCLKAGGSQTDPLNSSYSDAVADLSRLPVETPTEELELCDTWPPFPFYPTSIV